VGNPSGRPRTRHKFRICAEMLVQRVSRTPAGSDGQASGIAELALHCLRRKAARVWTCAGTGAAQRLMSAFASGECSARANMRGWHRAAAFGPPG
jgi:hypothetical protein